MFAWGGLSCIGEATLRMGCKPPRLEVGIDQSNALAMPHFHCRRLGCHPLAPRFERLRSALPALLSPLDVLRPDVHTIFEQLRVNATGGTNTLKVAMPAA